MKKNSLQSLKVQWQTKIHESNTKITSQNVEFSRRALYKSFTLFGDVFGTIFLRKLR